MTSSWARGVWEGHFPGVGPPRRWRNRDVSCAVVACGVGCPRQSHQLNGGSGGDICAGVGRFVGRRRRRCRRPVTVVGVGPDGPVGMRL